MEFSKCMNLIMSKIEILAYISDEKFEGLKDVIMKCDLPKISQ